MKSFASYLLLLCLAASALVTGCRIPRIPVKQTVDYAGEFTVGEERIRRYRARDFSTLDTTEAITRLEYLPIDIFAVMDQRDSVKLYVVSTWQEYLWRFSLKMDPVDRQYYAPTPLGIQFGADTAVINWGYPAIVERDREMRHSQLFRNDYWSIDVVKPTKTPEEVWSGVLRSVPQNRDKRYDPFMRFNPGGTYHRAMADTTWMLRILHTELRKTLGASEGDDGNR
jgi:hypothetical protein